MNQSQYIWKTGPLEHNIAPPMPLSVTCYPCYRGMESIIIYVASSAFANAPADHEITKLANEVVHGLNEQEEVLRIFHALDSWGQDDMLPIFERVQQFLARTGR